jgi:hypothetical protein
VQPTDLLAFLGNGELTTQQLAERARVPFVSARKVVLYLQSQRYVVRLGVAPDERWSVVDWRRR